jgi:hypothetical protein
LGATLDGDYPTQSGRAFTLYLNVMFVIGGIVFLSGLLLF